MNPAVFLDRDNTIIHNDGDLGDPDKVRLIQGAATAIASLCGLGYKVVVVTNQGGVARGKYGEADVDATHERLHELVRQAANGARIDGFYYCPFHPQGTVEEYRQEHHTRKPQPGMLLQAAEDLKLDLSQSWMVGDALRDIQAGARAGTRTVLVKPDAKPEDEIPTADDGTKPDFVARNIVEAVRIIAHARKPDGDPGPGTRSTPPASPRSPQNPAKPSDAKPSGGSTDLKAQAGGQRATAAASKRPFRPWDAPPLDEDEPIAVKLRRRKAETASAAVSSPAPETSKAVQPGNAIAERPPEQMGKPTEQPKPEASSPTPAADVESAPEPAPAVKPPAKKPSPSEQAISEADEPLADASSSKTLRLILQELRSQRGMTGEFSYHTVLAIVLQMVAGLCLLGALWMGAGDDGLFMRWMGAGLLMQGATIAALLFGRSPQ